MDTLFDVLSAYRHDYCFERFSLCRCAVKKIAHCAYLAALRLPAFTLRSSPEARLTYGKIKRP
jgi:hypothetical protein